MLFVITTAVTHADGHAAGSELMEHTARGILVMLYEVILPIFFSINQMNVYKSARHVCTHARVRFRCISTRRYNISYIKYYYTKEERTVRNTIISPAELHSKESWNFNTVTGT